MALKENVSYRPSSSSNVVNSILNQKNTTYPFRKNVMQSLMKKEIPSSDPPKTNEIVKIESSNVSKTKAFGWNFGKDSKMTTFDTSENIDISKSTLLAEDKKRRKKKFK